MQAAGFKNQKIAKIDILAGALTWLNVERRLLSAGLEGQMKLVSDLWPEFPQHIKSHIGADAHGSPLRHGTKATFGARMIEIAYGLGTCGAQPFRVVEHQVSRVAVGDEDMPHGMQQPMLRAAASQAIVTWILPEDRWIKEGVEEVSLNVIGYFREIALSIACSTFVERGIISVLLRPPRIPCCAHEIDGLKAVPQEEVKFFLCV